jgi:predicted SAM-dependent methyltransferase
MIKLDLGCGTSKKEGYIGVDSLSLPGVDIVHNLTVFPYPFSDNYADEILMDNVLEHLPQPLRVVEELYRICKKDAKVIIAVPYFRSYYATIDPTHVNFFGTNWFNYFDPNHPFQKKYQYSYAKFKVEKIYFDEAWFSSKKASWFHKRLIKFAEKRPAFYEYRLSHLLPLNSLTFILRVLK